MTARASELTEIKETLERMDAKLTTLSTVLLGPDGQESGGLSGRVGEIQRGHQRLELVVYALIALLVGLGVLSGLSFAEFMK